MVVRQLSDSYAALAEDLLRSDVFAELTAEGRVPRTRWLEDAPPRRTLEHERIWPVTYPFEWLPEMLAEAGALILSLNRRLLVRGYLLEDGTPRNVLFRGAEPVFVDLSAVAPSPADGVWGPFDQFAREVLYPLYLSAWGLDGIWRHHLRATPRAGVDLRAFSAAMPLSFRVRHPLRGWRLRLLSRKAAAAPPTVGGWLRDYMRTNAPLLLDRLFARTQRELGWLRDRITRRASAGWASYYPRDTDADVLARKRQAVAELLGRLRPGRVLDLGANRGDFSLLAAESGASVVAADTDEGSLRVLWKEARERRAPVTPLVMDAACPSPAVGLGAGEFPGATDRLRPDLLLALGLIHHLVRHNDYTFEVLIRGWSAYQPGVMIVEYVDPGDPRARTIGLRPRPWYTLDGLKAAVGSFFPAVDVIPLSETRSLVVAGRERD